MLTRTATMYVHDAVTAASWVSSTVRQVNIKGMFLSPEASGHYQENVADDRLVHETVRMQFGRLEKQR